MQDLIKIMEENLRACPIRLKDDHHRTYTEDGGGSLTFDMPLSVTFPLAYQG